MAILENGLPLSVEQGDYALVIDHTSGDVTISISLHGGNFIPVENGNFFGNATKIIQLPSCRIMNTATGTSVVDLSKARAFGN